MRLRSKFAVKCAKATSSLIKKLNRGSGVTLPGYVARLIDPNILKELSGQVRKKTIVTMGTNGKTTTNAILCKALEHEGQKVIINRTGANMLNGIISAFVLATDKHGNLDADYACIEVDEIASVGVLPKIEPDCALLTNISRDQLDRFGEVDITYNKLMTAVTSVPKTTLIINCDDILSYSLAQVRSAKPQRPDFLIGQDFHLLCGKFPHNFPFLHTQEAVCQIHQIVKPVFRYNDGFFLLLQSADNVCKAVGRCNIQIGGRFIHDIDFRVNRFRRRNRNFLAHPI